MSKLDSITIRPVPLHKLGELRDLFVSAVRTNFTYFDTATQEQTIASHSYARLLLAALHPRRLVLTAWIDGVLIGYAVASVPRRGEAQLYWLFVAPTYRGSNAGLALLSRVLRSARQLGATSLVLATHDHRRYYERQGFRYIDTTADHGVSLDVLRYQLV